MIHLSTPGVTVGVTGADSLEEQFGSGPSASRGLSDLAPCTVHISEQLYDGSPLWTRGREQ